jgi:U4/U6.U5 tri-snRNP-associated protein 1
MTKPLRLVPDLDSNFVDDEELQPALARSRRAKIPKTTKMSLQVRDEAEAAQEIDIVVDDKTAGSLTFDDTSEFCTLHPVQQPFRSDIGA